MLSVIIASEGQEQPAVATLAALVPGAAAGLIRDVLLCDRAASNAIVRVADVAGCAYLATPGSDAAAWAAGAEKARSPWLMFLRAGAVLDPTWLDEAAQFIQSVAASGAPRAAIFRYARSPYARPNWRDHGRSVFRALGFASVDQGLLIAREHYEKLGGHRAQTETQLLRRLGRAGRMTLRSRIVVG